MSTREVVIRYQVSHNYYVCDNSAFVVALKGMIAGRVVHIGVTTHRPGAEIKETRSRQGIPQLLKIGHPAQVDIGPVMQTSPSDRPGVCPKTGCAYQVQKQLVRRAQACDVPGIWMNLRLDESYAKQVLARPWRRAVVAWIISAASSARADEADLTDVLGRRPL